MIELKTVTLAVPVNERDHVMGPTNARVTVVNYFATSQVAVSMKSVP